MNIQTLIELTSGHEVELNDVLGERFRQILKWGDVRNMTPEEWGMILAEENGEVAKETVEIHWGGGRHRLGGYYDEMVQVAAVALAAMQDFNRQHPRADVGRVNIANCSACGAHHTGLTLTEQASERFVLCPNKSRRVYVTGDALAAYPTPMPGALMPNGNVCAPSAYTDNGRDVVNTFCEKPGRACTDTMCDNNGCAERVRHWATHHHPVVGALASSREGVELRSDAGGLNRRGFQAGDTITETSLKADGVGYSRKRGSITEATRNEFDMAPARAELCAEIERVTASARLYKEVPARTLLDADTAHKTGTAADVAHYIEVLKTFVENGN